MDASLFQDCLELADRSRRKPAVGMQEQEDVAFCRGRARLELARDAAFGLDYSYTVLLRDLSCRITALAVYDENLRDAALLLEIAQAAPDHFLFVERRDDDGEHALPLDAALFIGCGARRLISLLSSPL